jgi:hypothetical protein
MARGCMAGWGYEGWLPDPPIIDWQGSRAAMARCSTAANAVELEAHIQFESNLKH